MSNVDELSAREQVDPKTLQALFHEGLLSEKAYTHAVEWFEQQSFGNLLWRRFLEYGFLFLGIALFVAGVIYFFAYNWFSMGRFLKFGLLEGAILGAALLAWRAGLDKLLGKALLLLAIFLVGPLLAVFGQVYQTGADAYTLFLGWSALVLGWVLVSRFAVAWFFWLVVANTTIVLFFMQTARGTDGFFSACLYSFLFNAVSLFLWEFLSENRFSWLQTPSRWAVRLIYCGALFVLSLGVFSLIFHPRHRRVASHLALLLPVFYLLGGALSLWIYSSLRRDLLPLSAFALSFIVVSSCFVGRHLGGALLETFFSLGLLVLIEVAVAVYLLRKVHRNV